MRDISEVLAEHVARPVGSPHCACGWRPALSLNDTESDRHQHRQHQTAMLAARGVTAPTVSAEQVEALRVVIAGAVGPMSAFSSRQAWARAVRHHTEEALIALGIDPATGEVTR